MERLYAHSQLKNSIRVILLLFFLILATFKKKDYRGVLYEVIIMRIASL